MFLNKLWKVGFILDRIFGVIEELKKIILNNDEIIFKSNDIESLRNKINEIEINHTCYNQDEVNMNM